jgi:hypothetical protein
MKLAYRAAAINGQTTGYTVLADEGNPTLAEKITGYQPVLAKSPFEAPGYGAAGVTVVDMGNEKWKIAFVIERVHASPDAAAQFLVQHPAAFAAISNVDLQITVGATVIYFPACAVTEFTPDPHSDQSTRIKYAFSGGNYTLIPP